MNLLISLGYSSHSLIRPRNPLPLRAPLLGATECNSTAASPIVPSHSATSPAGADLTVLEFISFGAHIGSGYGGADMPLIGPIPEGRTFFCPHCGALYSVTYSRLSKSDSDIAKCVVCLQIMTSWDSTKVPIYKLVQRPEDA
jgi:hypothetical protein